MSEKKNWRAVERDGAPVWFCEYGRRRSRGGFGAGNPALQKFDLAVVIGFVFGDVEPFSEIVHAHIGVHDGEPFVVPLFELGEIFFARFVKDVEVVVEIVAFDGFARGLVEIHGDVPFLFDFVGPGIPLRAAKGVHAVIRFGCGEVHQQGTDGVGLGVEKKIEILLREPFDVRQNLHPREGHHRNERADFGRVAFLRADEPGLIFRRKRGRRGERESGYSGRDGCANLQEITARGKRFVWKHRVFSSV